MAAPRNMLSGYAEPAHINDFMFEQQRRTFVTYGKSLTVESVWGKVYERESLLLWIIVFTWVISFCNSF